MVGALSVPESVLITGASSGIGRQLALDYARNGARVVACGRHAGRLDDLVATCPGIVPLCFDATDRQATRQALASLPSLPTLVVLGAGNCEYVEAGQLDGALFKRVFDANLVTLVHCIEALQSRLAAGSRLAIIGSSACYFPFPRAEAYGASKAAVRYLALTLAVDLAPRGVAVSLISPGFVKTPLTDRNDFPMPFLISCGQASLAIRRGLAAGHREICFPKRLVWLLKFLAILPVSWQTGLASRLRKED